MTQTYGKPPVDCGTFEHCNLDEVMYYLYLPIAMIPEIGFPPGRKKYLRMPDNVKGVADLVYEAVTRENDEGRKWLYVYLSARKGWATPDNPLNRPGWHCDGFGGPDMNYVWWLGASTRFFVGNVTRAVAISEDHIESLKQFDLLPVIHPGGVETRAAKHLYQLDRYTIHATPELTEGQMRQYVKISFSNERYNLYGNSHNYLFDYDWPMVDRELVRNDTSKAQGDHA